MNHSDQGRTRGEPPASPLGSADGFALGVVGCQPGAERPTDRGRKRTGEKRERASDWSFIWFGSVSLSTEGSSGSLGTRPPWSILGKKQRRGGQGVVGKEYPSRTSIVETLLSSQDPVFADVLRGYQAVESSEGGRSGEIWNTAGRTR